MNDNLRAAVFCGSTMGNKKIYREKAVELAEAMNRRSVSLVYGGGNRGLMGVLAHAVYDGGGHVTGVLPASMNFDSVTDGTKATETIITSGMHERKKTMYSLASGFIAMPGGIGTFEELCEIYTWRQLGYTEGNIALYNVDDYFAPFLIMLEKAVEEGFLAGAVKEILIVTDDPEALLDHLFSDRKELPSKLSTTHGTSPGVCSGSEHTLVD